jgi:hypothetical protein
LRRWLISEACVLSNDFLIDVHVFVSYFLYYVINHVLELRRPDIVQLVELLVARNAISG